MAGEQERSGRPPSEGALQEGAVNASLAFVLFGLGRLIERELEVRLADEGLSLRTLGVLGHLAGAPDLSYSDLARRADVTVQTMHATVRGMIAGGLVAARGRVGQPAALTLTDTGRARLRAAAATLAVYEGELVNGCDVDRDALATTARALAFSAWRSRTPSTP